MVQICLLFIIKLIYDFFPDQHFYLIWQTWKNICNWVLERGLWQHLRWIFVATNQNRIYLPLLSSVYYPDLKFDVIFRIWHWVSLVTFSYSSDVSIKFSNFAQRRFISEGTHKNESIARSIIDFSKCGELVLAGCVKYWQFIGDTINVMPFYIIILKSWW